MPWSKQRVVGAVCAWALLALGTAAVQAGDEDIRALDRKFREVAARSTPATVLVKCTLADGTGRAGFGSGATISADGYILTCSHVVDLAGEVEITTAGGDTYPARLLGKNPKQDYAMLKVEVGDPLPYFKIGDSTKVALGQWVVALGHPGGPYPDLKPAFAVGRVTGLHRRLPVQMMDRYYDDAIRTDAPIFAGNSGGPLVNLDGELVGLNGAILLINENSYAVPMHEIVPNLDRLKGGEHIEGRSPEGGLGAPMDEFQGKDLARFLGRAGRRLLGREGLGKLVPGSGPERDELARMLERIGKSLEGERAQRTLEQLFEGFSERNRGEGGATPEMPDFENLRKQLEGLFGDRGGDGKGPAMPDLGELRERLGKLFGRGDGDRDGGATARPGTPGAGRAAPASFLGVVPATGPESADLAGIEVIEVVEGSPAAGAGLRPGDVVVGLGTTRIETPADLRFALERHAPGEKVRLRYLRTRLADGVPVDEPKEVEVALARRDEEGR